jgi:hypothetical protein
MRQLRSTLERLLDLHLHVHCENILVTTGLEDLEHVLDMQSRRCATYYIPDLALTGRLFVRDNSGSPQDHRRLRPCREHRYSD